MVFWIASVVGGVIAYLFGSTPTGYLAGKLLKGIDIREHGSKSIGATNVLRTLGKWPALVVLLVDVLKGVGAIVFICGLEQPLPYRLLVIAGGIYVIVRHRANIQRLLAGTEPRLGQSSPESKAEPTTASQI